MSRYIDADKYKKDLIQLGFLPALVARALDNQPTADVVEVVRCKDCQHRYVPCRCALWYGTANDKEYFSERGEDFYCSYGERSENE